MRPASNPPKRRDRLRDPPEPAATLTLSQRLLATPNHRELEPLIPYTSSSPELALVNDRVYHLLALALRGYVQSWYSRLAPRDRTLLPAITRTVAVPVLAPILSGLTDNPDRANELVLVDIPVLATTHVRTFWSARAALASGLAAGGTRDLATAYHARAPLLSVERASDVHTDGGGATYILSPVYLGAVADSLLKLRLDKRDAEADAERLIIREVVARAFLASVGRRLAAPWFWCQVALKLIGEPGTPTPTRRRRRVGVDTGSSPSGGGGSVAHSVVRIWAAFWSAVATVWTAAAWLVATLSACPPREHRFMNVCDPWLALGSAWLGIDSRSGLSTPLWSARMTWGALEMVVRLASPMLDRLLPHLVLTRLLTPATALRIADLIERILFPDGYPGPSPVDPTPEEATDLMRRFQARVDEILPSAFKTIFTSGGDSDVAALLAPITDPGCNAHLVGMLYSAIIAALAPELDGDEAADPIKV